MHVGLRQSGEAEGHPGFKSFRRGAEVRAKRPPRADDLLAMLMCCGAFASRMFLFCDLSCHLFTLACQAYAALALLRCCISCVCERVGLSGRWVCGLVSSPAVVPVRCLRAVKKVESSRVRYLELRCYGPHYHLIGMQSYLVASRCRCYKMLAAPWHLSARCNPKRGISHVFILRFVVSSIHACVSGLRGACVVAMLYTHLVCV